MSLQKVGMRGRMLLVLLGAGIILQGCMKSDVETYNGYQYLQDDIATIGKYLEANNIIAELDSSLGIFFEVHERGAGYKTIAKTEIEAHFEGSTLDGVEFVNTFDSSPVSITLAVPDTYLKTVTDGLVFGLANMHQGDSATIYVPSPLGYQNNSYNNVPPNSILVYNVKFVKVKKLDEEYALIDQYIIDNNITASIDPEFGTRYAIHRAGNGITPRPGAFVSLDYQGELLDGSIFESSYDTGRPLDFTYASGDLIPGFEMGVANLHENDSATIFIPSIYGYKDVAKGESIPANSVLVFGLEVIRISNIN